MLQMLQQQCGIDGRLLVLERQVVLAVYYDDGSDPQPRLLIREREGVILVWIELMPGHYRGTKQSAGQNAADAGIESAVIQERGYFGQYNASQTIQRQPQIALVLDLIAETPLIQTRRVMRRLLQTAQSA